MAKGKKGKKKIDPLKLNFVEDAFYRLTVQDCEKKIERLSKHLENLDTNNDEIKEKIRSLNFDQVDKAADMTRSLRSYDETIYKFQEEIQHLTQEFADMKSRGDATISDLEDKYKAMHDQLTAEIKLLKAKLQILEDFRKTEEKVQFIIENEKELLKEKNEHYKEVIENMKLKIQVEKETMKKAIESRLFTVSEEFTHNSALRDAAYAQRLIRENIALEKEIDVLISSQKSMEQQLKEKMTRGREVKETFPALNRKKREYIFIAQQKTNLIERLTTKYEKLRSSYTESLLYKNQYLDLIQYKMCRHCQQHQLVTKAKKLAARAHMLKYECHYLKNKYEINEKEKERLKDVIILTRKTVLDAVKVYEEKPVAIVQQPMLEKSFSKSEISTNKQDQTLSEEQTISSQNQNTNLLEDLLDILARLKVELTPTASIETVTPNSFLQKHSDLLISSSDSLREPFKHRKKGYTDSNVSTKDEMQFFRQDSKTILPKERLERCLLLDVEKGTSYYASSVKVKSETIPEEQEEFRSQESSSYDSFTEQEVEETQKVKTKEEHTKHKVLPPGTIVDVEFEEESEQSDLENEEYSMNYDEETNSSREHAEPEEEMSIYMFY